MKIDKRRENNTNPKSSVRVNNIPQHSTHVWTCLRYVPAEEEKEGAPMHIHINTKIKPKKSTRKQENNFHEKKKKKTFETDHRVYLDCNHKKDGIG
jgi:hypothetical protein